jgi:hypothetical protein
MFQKYFMERLSLVEDIWACNVKDVFASPRSTQSLLCGALVWCDVQLVCLAAWSEFLEGKLTCESCCTGVYSNEHFFCYEAKVKFLFYES